MVMSYSCDLSEKRDIFAARRCTARQHPCRKSHSTDKDMVMGKDGLSRVVAETMGTRRRVEELQESAGNLARGDRSRKKREVLDETDFFLARQSLAECSSFVEEFFNSDRVVTEDLYSVFTFESPQNFHLGVRRLLRTFLIHFFLLDQTFSLLEDLP